MRFVPLRVVCRFEAGIGTVIIPARNFRYRRYTGKDFKANAHGYIIFREKRTNRHDALTGHSLTSDVLFATILTGRVKRADDCANSDIYRCQSFVERPCIVLQNKCCFYFCGQEVLTIAVASFASLCPKSIDSRVTRQVWNTADDFERRYRNPCASTPIGSFALFLSFLLFGHEEDEKREDQIECYNGRVSIFLNLRKDSERKMQDTLV